VAALEVADELARHGDLTLSRAAQLAHDPSARTVVHVDVLAHERGASAVGAAVPVRLQGAQAEAKQMALELVGVVCGG
jgi:hypothetical protein